MPSRRQALLISSTFCYGYASMLEFAKEDICTFLKAHDVTELVFVPYAQKDHDGYTDVIKKAIEPWGFEVTGLHKFNDVVDKVKSSKAIFIGGGNTFLLLKTLHDNKLVAVIREKVDEGSLIYIGSSAGTNVATRTIHTTNDMPIVLPPQLEAIGIVPFNINAHYTDTKIDTFMGASRDEKILQYLELGNATVVLGIREGCVLQVDKDQLTVKGKAGAVLFKKNEKTPQQFAVGSDLSFLLEQVFYRM